MPGAVMVSAGFVHLLGTAIKELDPMDTFPLAPFLCGPLTRCTSSHGACLREQHAPCTLYGAYKHKSTPNYLPAGALPVRPLNTLHKLTRCLFA